ncbi:MAG: hypothetical protein R8M46_04530 [Ghiorsea sp.]
MDDILDFRLISYWKRLSLALFPILVYKYEMGIKYYIDQESRIVFTSVVGSLEGHDLYEHQDTLKADPQFDPQMNEIMNCLGLNSVKLSTVVHTHLVSASPWGSDAKRAIIVSNPLNYNLLHIFKVFMQGKHGSISIFHDIKSAESWLHEQETVLT